jgi:hypothetical protein
MGHSWAMPSILAAITAITSTMYGIKLNTSGPFRNSGGTGVYRRALASLFPLSKLIYKPLKVGTWLSLD